MNTVPLSTIDLALAAAGVLCLAVLNLMLAMGQARSLVVAAARATVQLLIMGLVLRWLFDTTHAGWVLLMACAMVLLAGREVVSRQQRRLGGWWGYGVGTVAMFVSSLAVVTSALLVIVQPEPWHAPRYAIPLLGMVLGNTMTGIALGLDRLTQSTLQQTIGIEARLLLGHTWDDAISSARRDSARAALTPIINSMAAAGVVSLPGMMTGQILSGTPPVEAVKYQILILFLIAIGTGLGSLAAIWIASRRLFDGRHRLRLDRLAPAPDRQTR